MQIRLAGILPNSNANGLGLRKAIFSQGCSHACPDCFNKHTWDFKGGRICDCDEIIKDILDETYLAGVTFTGGDPFDQPEPFAYIAKAIHPKNINIWCYTGYTWEELIHIAKTNKAVDELLHNIDTLVDGTFKSEFVSDEIEFRGSSNQRIIDVQKSLSQKSIIIDKRFK